MAEFTFDNYDDRFISSMKVSVPSFSPKMDLIACGSAKGDVGLHRYRMVTAWESNAPDLGSVTHIAWRPDGQMVAVAYASGWLHFCLLEDGFVFHKRHLDAPVTHLDWVAAPEDLLGNLEQWSDVDNFLPNLADMVMDNHNESTNQDEIRKVTSVLKDMENSFSILVITTGFNVHLCGNGFYHIAGFVLDSSEYRSSEDDKLLRATLSADYRTLSFIMKRYDEQGRTVFREHRVDTSSLRDNLQELRKVSMQSVAVMSCKRLLNSCISQIKESWEDTLLELDMKLTSYARKRAAQDPDWSLRTELLELLLFGHARCDLRNFLIDEWTANGIKQLGATIANTYDKIQRTCYKQIQLLLQSVLFHASEMLGLVRSEKKYTLLGFSETCVKKLIRDAGAAMQKTQEVQLVIDNGTKHLKAFFSWLYVCILQLNDEEVPVSLQKTSAADQEMIVSFITEQLQPTTVNGKIEAFHIELVEQYMVEGHLKKPMEMIPETDMRAELCSIINKSQENGDQDNPDGIFTFHSTTSLVDVMHDYLYRDISLVFNLNWPEFTQRYMQIDDTRYNTLLRMGELEDYNLEVITMCETVENESILWTAFLLPSKDTIAVCRENSNQDRVSIQIQLDKIPKDDSTDGSYSVEDMRFFSHESVALLVSRTSPDSASPPFYALVFISLAKLTGVFTNVGPSDASLDFTILPDQEVNVIRISEFLLDVNVERLPRKAIRLTVNGSRKIAFILFESEQQCRTYILDPVEEDTDVMDL